MSETVRQIDVFKGTAVRERVLLYADQAFRQRDRCQILTAHEGEVPYPLQTSRQFDFGQRGTILESGVAYARHALLYDNLHDACDSVDPWRPWHF